MDQLAARVGKLPALSLLEWRNEATDAFFYDVSSITPDEVALLSPLIDLKGTIVAVSPARASRKDRIRHYKSSLLFHLQEGETIGAIAVAGVGSSVLGTAALARNVADHTGWDVAGVVTGYGVSDLLTEALGGWFYYGWADRFRYAMGRAVDNLLTPTHPAERVVPAFRGAAPTRAEGVAPRALPGGMGYPLGSFDALGNSDVRTLHDLLVAGPPRLRLLVGHSKGNLLISFTLNHLASELGESDGFVEKFRQKGHPLFNGLNVTTLGAVVDIPTKPFSFEVHQLLGALDMLGWLNSDHIGLGIAPHTSVPGVMHHTNTKIPFHLSVAKSLEMAGVPRDVNAPPEIEDGPLYDFTRLFQPTTELTSSRA